MKRTAIIACLLSTGVLASCTSLIDDQPAPTHTSGQEGADVVDASSGADASTDAFHFASGDLEIGPFDPEETLPVLFNPCKEISADEFAAIGFTTDGVTIPAHGGQVLGCGLESDKYWNYSITLAGSLGSNADVVEQQLLIDEDPSVLIPSLRTYSPDVDGESCIASVETARGSFSAGVANYYDSLAQEPKCELAIGILESLFTYK